MACRHQLENFRLSCSVSLRIVEIGRPLQTLFSVRLLLCHVMSILLHNRIIEPLSLPVCVHMVGCGGVVSETPHTAYEVVELGNKLLPVVGEDVPGAAVCVNPVLQKRSGSCSCCSVPGRDATRQFDEAVGYDQDAGAPPRCCLSWERRPIARNWRSPVAGKELHQLLLLEVCSRKLVLAPKVPYSWEYVARRTRSGRNRNRR